MQDKIFQVIIKPKQGGILLMTPSLKREICARIKEERIKRNLKQKDCVKHLDGITIQMLSQWETGDAP